MAGYNQEYKHTKYYWAGRKELINDSNPAMNQATGEKNLGYSESQWAINGFFARINYNYKQRYLLELNGRYDGSSKFAEADRYAFFPSVSAAWRMSEEAFFVPAKKWIDDLKIRGSWGSLGNQVVDELGNFPYLPSYGVNTSYAYLLGGSRPVAVTPSGLVSGAFTWETVTQMDFGFDAVLLNNRLSATFDWYRRDTKDMLTAGQSLPAVLGTNIPVENAADLKTTGWELSLGWTDRLSNGLSYWVKGVLSDYQGEITKFTNDAGSLSSRYVGQKINEIWGYRSEGLFQSDAEADSHVDQSYLYGGKWGAGDVKYVDLNNDGKIDASDRTFIGNPHPDLTGGVNLSVGWKGFDLSTYLYFSVGNDIFAMYKYYTHYGSLQSAYSKIVATTLGAGESKRNLPMWATATGESTIAANESNSSYIEDGSFLRMQTLTLGYTLPKAWMNKIKFDKIRIYGQISNVFTLTGYSGLDPQVRTDDGSGNSKDRNMGTDYGSYGMPRQFILGVNVTF